ncbi:hypothetical protein DXE55_13220 [Escherichia coli O145]|nr:hypothetical protein DXE49_09835 [Escherichia coli O145]QNS91029.1 hypothetical protein EW646_12675 [Escherichia coli O145]QNS95006.1 hypothetical protein EW648_05830 [Escherichia coli O145]QNT01409.1 hypothetical protein DXE55_13220 [Escherichia coli O145]
MTDFRGKTSIFSHPVYLFLRKFSLQDSRGGSRCGGRSAYSRTGGYDVVCYESDVTDEMIRQWKQENAE